MKNKTNEKFYTVPTSKISKRVSVGVKIKPEIFDYLDKGDITSAAVLAVSQNEKNLVNAEFDKRLEELIKRAAM